MVRTCEGACSEYNFRRTEVRRYAAHKNYINVEQRETAPSVCEWVSPIGRIIMSPRPIENRLYGGFSIGRRDMRRTCEEALKRFKKAVEADYLLTGNHFLISGVGAAEFVFTYPWGKVPPAEQNRKLSNHFKTIAKAVRSGLFDFLAHPDFIRRPSPCGEYDLMEERLDIADALVETGIPVKLNTKGYSEIGDFYPARWMLEEIAKHQIPMLINDDAHTVSGLGANYKEAEQRLEETGNTVRIDLADLLK